MKSWDCWDTLIARRSIVDVRNEEGNVFSIAENIAKVSPQDVLVSDYYDEPLLCRLMRETAGLRNRLVVTEAGKMTGEVWRRLEYLQISEHTGDNPHSDVEMPRRHGINTRLSQLSDFTPVEQGLHDSGLKGLALTIREARLSEYSAGLRSLQLLQTQVNFPLLFIASIILHRSHPAATFLMSSRDCCLWRHVQELVRDLHAGRYRVVYFRTSRICRAFPSGSYLEYVNENLPGVIVDLTGTGWSLTRLLERTEHRSTPIVFITRVDAPALAAQYRALGGASMTGNINVLLQSPAPHTDIETMNTADHAMYVDATQTWNPLGIDWKHLQEIQVMHATFMTAVQAARHYDFSSDVAVADSELQKHLLDCLIRVNADHLYGSPLHMLLHAENDAIMQRLADMSAREKRSRPHSGSCDHDGGQVGNLGD